MCIKYNIFLPCPGATRSNQIEKAVPDPTLEESMDPDPVNYFHQMSKLA